jgi:hypothetical protein
MRGLKCIISYHTICFEELQHELLACVQTQPKFNNKNSISSNIITANNLDTLILEGEMLISGELKVQFPRSSLCTAISVPPTLLVC